MLTLPGTRRCPKPGRTAEKCCKHSLDGPAPFMNADSGRIEPLVTALAGGLAGVCEVGREDVDGVPVEVATGPVVAGGGTWVGMAGGDLHVS